VYLGTSVVLTRPHRADQHILLRTWPRNLVNCGTQGLANPTIHRQAPLDTKTSNRKEANTHIMKPAIKARRAADAFNLSSTVQAHPEQDGGR